MKTLLRKCSDVEEKIHNRNKKTNKNEEQIQALKKKNKEQLQTDQKDAERLARKDRNLRKILTRR